VAFKKSGNPKVLDITKSCKERSTCLDRIRPIVLEELNVRGKPKRLCAWCAEVEILNGNQKYCTNDCSNSAEAWAYPQKEQGLKFLLIRQEWKCAHCQYDYRPVMDDMIEKEAVRYPAMREYKVSIDKLPWYYFKRFKHRVEKEHKPEVDHIVPISKGGDSLGLDNHNVLCYTCHKTKTKVDLSGKRPKKV
jgi:hypothetical protein